MLRYEARKTWQFRRVAGICMKSSFRPSGSSQDQSHTTDGGVGFHPGKNQEEDASIPYGGKSPADHPCAVFAPAGEVVGQKPEQPPEGKKPPIVAAPKRWPRRLASFILGMVFLALVALAIPWSPVALKRRVEREISQRLGCGVEIGRATIWPLLGEIKLRKLKLDYSHSSDRLRFVPPDAAVWKLEEAVMRLRPAWRQGSGLTADFHLRLRDADPVILTLRDRSLLSFPPLSGGSFKGTSTAKGVRKWQPRSIAVENASLCYLPPAAEPDRKKDARATERADQTCVVLSQVRFDGVRDFERMKDRFSITGRFGPKGQTPFSAQVVRHGNLWTAQSQTDSFHFGSILTGRGKEPSVRASALRGSVRSISLQGQAQRHRDGSWDFHLGVACPQFEILGVVEKNTSITAQGRVDERTSRGMILLEVLTPDSHVRLRSSLVLNGPEDSQTTLSIERLADGWFDLWSQRRPAHFPAVEASREQSSGTKPIPPLTVTATARLRSTRPWIEQPRAHILLSGAHLISEYLPFSIRDVNLEADVAPERIVLRRCRGRWPHGWVSLHGAHEGLWFPRREGTTRLAWAFQLRAEDLLTTLPTAAETALTTVALAAFTRRPVFEGDLAGSGTLVLGWKRSERETGGEKPETKSGSLATKTLQGSVVLRRGRIEHPGLPAPVTDIDGTFEISPQRAQINSVFARVLGTTATLQAVIEGKPFFWSTPQARCSIQTEVAIAQAVRFAPEQVRPRIEAVEPRGNLAMRLSVAGPLRQPFRADDIVATGTAILRDLAFRSPTWVLDGTFHDLRGRVELVNGIVRLTTATGWLEQVPFFVRAEADPRAGRFWARLESASPFVAVQKVMPRALSRFEVGGDLSSWVELEASDRDLFQKAGRLQGLTGETVANLPFEWDLRGELTARDVQMTFETFPTSLTEINGRARLRKFGWTFEDMTSSWGKTEKCRIEGGGRFRPGNWPVMHIDLSAPVLYLDEWIRPWRRSPGSRFPPRVVNPVFELTGALRGPKGYYRGHPGANARGEFQLVSPYMRPDVFRFFNMSLDVYGGRMTGQGQIIFRRGSSTCTLELAADHVLLQPLIQCESGREQTFVGRLTGEGRFDWRDGLSETLTSRGRLLVTESRFLGNIFFRRLGQLIKIPFLNDVPFSTIETPYRIASSRVTFDRMAMNGPLITMVGSGFAGFDHSLDFVVELGFPHLPRYVWLLDWVVQAFGKVPSSVFSLDLHGTWDDPQYGFHHLTTAEEGLLSGLGALWGLVAPSTPAPPK